MPCHYDQRRNGFCRPNARPSEERPNCRLQRKRAETSTAVPLSRTQSRAARRERTATYSTTFFFFFFFFSPRFSSATSSSATAARSVSLALYRRGTAGGEGARERSSDESRSAPSAVLTCSPSTGRKLQLQLGAAEEL